MGIIPGVAVNLANGNIGGPANTNSGVVGQILTGAGTGVIALLQPCMFVSLADAINQGLTQAAEPEAYQFVEDFYNDAPIGSVLYLMLAAATVSIQSLCDKTNANYASKLLNFAIGTAGGQIRVLGVARTPGSGYSPVTDEFIDSDAVLAGANAQALVTAYFAAHTPVRVLIGARVADPASNVIFSPNTAGFNGLGYTIGGSETGEGSAGMGTILAKVAATAIQVNIGRVKDGPLSINNWYIGALSIAPPASGVGAWYQQINVLINAGYITVTNYAGKAGYFISDDPMATALTDDYQSLANCRVIDEASILAYQSFLDNLKDDVDLVAGGTLDPGQAVDLQAKIVNALALGLSGNISGTPSVVIDTTQVLSAGQPLNVQLRVTPKGYLKNIIVNLGFSY